MDENTKYIDGKTKYRGVRIRGESIQIDFRYKGIRCRETLRMKPNATTLRTAGNLLGKINTDISMNNFNYTDYFPNSKKVEVFGGFLKTNMTVTEALDWWWEESKPTHHNTARTMEGYINNHIKPGIGNIYLSDLKTSQVSKWIKSLSLSASSKNSTLTPLRQMYEEACSEDLVEKNIMLNVKSFTREKKQKNALKINEINQLLDHIKVIDAQAYYQFAIWSGLSTGEQLGLKWADINFKNRQVNISRMLVDNIETTTKNSYRDRQIELLSPSIHALYKILPDKYFDNPTKYESEFIFKNPNTQNVWRLEAISDHWTKALKELKISHRRPYETRHTFASLMVTACLPDGWIRQQMGHANMEMLSRIYGQWHKDPEKVVNFVLKNTRDGNNGAQFNKLFLDLHEPNWAESLKENKCESINYGQAWILS